MDDQPVVPFRRDSNGSSNDSGDRNRRPSFIFHIGRQRFQMLIDTTITRLNAGPAEVIPIDKGRRVRKHRDLEDPNDRE